MDKEFKNLQMEIFIKDYIKLVNHQDLVNITGQMVAILKEFSAMDLEMGMVFGKEVLEIVINMKVIILKIRNKGMEFLDGKMVTYIKEIF